MRLSLRPVLLAVALLLLLGAALPAQQRVEVRAAHLSAEDVGEIRSAAERELRRVGTEIGERLDHPLEIVVLASEREIPQALRASFRTWTIAVASTHSYRIHVLADRLGSAPPDDLDSVLRHELVHIVLGDLELRLGAGRHRLPRWFHEGLAQEIAGSIYLSGQEEIVAVRLLTDTMLSWSKLSASFPTDRTDARAAYAQCASFFRFLRSEIGLAAVLAAARRYLAGRARNLDAALAAEQGVSFSGISADWERYIREGRGILALLERNCFSILLLLCVPLLFLVLRKRNLRERWVGRRLAELDAEDAEGDHEP